MTTNLDEAVGVARVVDQVANCEEFAQFGPTALVAKLGAANDEFSNTLLGELGVLELVLLRIEVDIEDFDLAGHIEEVEHEAEGCS